MMQIWPSRFPTMASAQPYAGNPRALANKVYNGRMGNAVGSDDGWNFRGRGGSQTTGREGYERVRKATGIDVVKHPDYLIDPRYFLTCAVSDLRLPAICESRRYRRRHPAAEWRHRGSRRAQGVAGEMEGCAARCVAGDSAVRRATARDRIAAAGARTAGSQTHH
jgi:hypothetical protein